MQQFSLKLYKEENTMMELSQKILEKEFMEVFAIAQTVFLILFSF